MGLELGDRAGEGCRPGDDARRGDVIGDGIRMGDELRGSTTRTVLLIGDMDLLVGDTTVSRLFVPNDVIFIAPTECRGVGEVLPSSLLGLPSGDTMGLGVPGVSVSELIVELSPYGLGGPISVSEEKDSGLLTGGISFPSRSQLSLVSVEDSPPSASEMMIESSVVMSGTSWSHSVSHDAIGASLGLGGRR